MKVYVDELPKSCSECEWFTPNHCSKDGRNFCLLARMPFYNTEEEREIRRGQHKDSLNDFDCPLHSLCDYTKQVRKEVCDGLALPLIKHFQKDAEFTVEEICKWIEEYKNQIQGETK